MDEIFSKPARKDDSDIMFSRSTATKEAYESRIDELFNGGKPSYGLKSAAVLDRSDMLDLLGYGDKPLYLNEGKLIKGQKDHPNVTADVWKKIPEWIENPALVFDSDDKIAKNVGRLVFVAPEQINNNPVFIIIEPDADDKGIKVDLLINSYDKNNSYPPFRAWVQDKDLLRYFNKAKSPAILARSGLQLSSLAQARSSKGKILRDSDLVKYRAENNPVLSRNEGFGLPLERAQEIIADITKEYTSLPPVIIVESSDDLPIDDALKSSELGDIEGMFYQGKIYINAGAIFTEKRMREVFAHEAIGHLSVETMLGEVDPKLMPKLINQVNNLDKLGNKYIRELAARVDKSQPSLKANKDFDTRAKEIIAQIAEAGDQDKNLTPIVRSMWQKVMDGIKAFAKLVFDVDMTDQDVRDIVAMAARYARGEDVVSTLIANKALFSTSAPSFDSQLAEFVKGNSKGALTIGRTPQALVKAGLPDTNLMVTQKVMDKIVYEHLPANIIKALPSLLSHPVMVFKSATQEGSFVALLDATHHGEPVIASIKPNGSIERISPVNVLTSSYNKPSGVIEGWLRDGLLIGADKKKALEFTTTNGVQFPTVVQQITKSLDLSVSESSEAVKQTDSPEFKKWFGDSKVVDADDKPLVVYHGTRSKEFSTFNIQDTGAYFTTNLEAAESYGEVMPVYLNMKNPLELDFEGESDMGDEWNIEDEVAYAKEEGYDGLIWVNWHVIIIKMNYRVSLFITMI